MDGARSWYQFTLSKTQVCERVNSCLECMLSQVSEAGPGAPAPGFGKGFPVVAGAAETG